MGDFLKPAVAIFGQKPYLSSFGRLFHRFGQLFSPTHWSPWTAIRLEIVQPREKDREREGERERERVIVLECVRRILWKKIQLTSVLTIFGPLQQ